MRLPAALFIIFTGLTGIASAAIGESEFTVGGYVLFWIFLSTLLLSFHRQIRAYLSTPLTTAIFIFVLILFYIMFSALTIVFDIGGWIDNLIKTVAMTIKGGL